MNIAISRDGNKDLGHQLREHIECAICKKSIEKLEVWMDHYKRMVCMEAQCHGETDYSEICEFDLWEIMRRKVDAKAQAFTKKKLENLALPQHWGNNTRRRKKMNPDKQRIAIAEACGWSNFRVSTIGRNQVLCGEKQGVFLLLVPDYLNSLEACHEMEKFLKGDFKDESSQKALYVENLVFACHGHPDEMVDIWNWHLIHAPAAQRCEAFLKTIGRWEDSNDGQSPIHKQPLSTPHE